MLMITPYKGGDISSTVSDSEESDRLQFFSDSLTDD